MLHPNPEAACEPLEHDFPPTMRYYRRRPEIIDGEYRVISTRRQRPPIGFLSCLAISALGMIVLLRFAWMPVIVIFAFSGVTSPAAMLGVPTI